MATKIASSHAVKIALALKKHLVDQNILELSQADLEDRLFRLLQGEYGQTYGSKNIYYYRLFSRFHHQRIPMILVVSGSACVRKSSLSAKLAERMNLPNVVDLDLMHEMLHLMDGRSQAESFIWGLGENEDFLGAFVNGCRSVADALTAELAKCFNEGKSLILEGTFIGPELLDLLDSLCKARISKQEKAQICPAVTVFFNLQWNSLELEQNHLKENFGHLLVDESSSRKTISRIQMLNDELLKRTRGFHTVFVDDFSRALEQMHDIVLESLFSE